MEPYSYVGNNPIMFTDPTGMSAEGPGDECGGPPESRKSSASTQAVKNLAKKYFSTAMSVLSDPVGSAQSAFQSVAQEGADFINKDGGNVANTIFRKGSEGYNSIVNRIKNSSDPAFEFQVIVKEYSYEAIANILVGEGLGALVGRGLGGTATTVSESLPVPYSTIKEHVVKKVHGNSLKSMKPTWGYKLYHNDGTFLKNGITSEIIPEKRYTNKFMKDKYMDAIKFDSRRPAYNWEAAQNKIQKGPLNKNNH